MLNPDKDSVVVFKCEPNKYTYSEVYSTYNAIKKVIGKHKKGKLIVLPKDITLKVCTREQLSEIRDCINKILESGGR